MRKTSRVTRRGVDELLEVGEIAVAFRPRVSPLDDATIVAAVRVESEVPASAIASLHPHDRATALVLGPARRSRWTGGRLALAAAFQELGVADAPPIPTGTRGEPLLPAGFTGSVSHTRGLSVAVLKATAAGALGVDVEGVHPARPQIESRVLNARETCLVAAADDQWLAIITRFSVKEAVYKALPQPMQEGLRFRDMTVLEDRTKTSDLAWVMVEVKLANEIVLVHAGYTLAHGLVFSLATTVGLNHRSGSSNTILLPA